MRRLPRTRRLRKGKSRVAVLDDPWPGCIRPQQLDTIELAAESLDTLSPGSVIELARQAGLLLEEEAGFAELVRVRLKRNQLE